MSEILLPRRFKSQPQYAAPIDKRGVGGKAQFALLGNQSYELISGIANSGTVGTNVATTEGIAYVLPSVATTWAKRVDALDPYVSGSFSVFWRGVLRADTLQTLLSYGTLAGWEFKSDGWAPGQIRFRLAGLFSGSGPTVGPVGVTDGTIHSVGVVYDDAAASVEFFLDGASIGSAGWTKDTAAATSTTFTIKGDATSPHKMLTVQAFAGKLSTAEMSTLSGNPWLTFRAPSRRIFSSAAASGTVALTGQSLTSSQGTLAPSTSVALTGQSLTSSQGTLAPGTSKALTGQSLTSSQGTLAPNTSVALSGQALTSAQGTLSANGSVTVALSGQSLTSSQGTLAPSTAVAVLGQALTASQGTLASATSIAISGQTLTASQGTLAPSATGQSITIQLTGQSLTTSQGSLSLDQYIWDTSQGRAQPGRGTFKPLKPDEMSKPEIVVVDIPEEESTYEHHPVSDVKPTRAGPRAGISGIKLTPRHHPGTTPAPVQNRDYKALMAIAGTKTKTMKLSDFTVKQNKKYLTKTRGPVTLKGN